MKFEVGREKEGEGKEFNIGRISLPSLGGGLVGAVRLKSKFNLFIQCQTEDNSSD